MPELEGPAAVAARTIALRTQLLHALLRVTVIDHTQAIRLATVLAVELDARDVRCIPPAPESELLLARDLVRIARRQPYPVALWPTGRPDELADARLRFYALQLSPHYRRVA